MAVLPLPVSGCADSPGIWRKHNRFLLCGLSVKREKLLCRGSCPFPGKGLQQVKQSGLM